MCIQSQDRLQPYRPGLSPAADAQDCSDPARRMPSNQAPPRLRLLLACNTMPGGACPFRGKLPCGSRLAHILCDGGVEEPQNSALAAPYSGITKQIKSYRSAPSLPSSPLLSLPLKQPFFLANLKAAKAWVCHSFANDGVAGAGSLSWAQITLSSRLRVWLSVVSLPTVLGHSSHRPSLEGPWRQENPAPCLIALHSGHGAETPNPAFWPRVSNSESSCYFKSHIFLIAFPLPTVQEISPPQSTSTLFASRCTCIEGLLVLDSIKPKEGCSPPWSEPALTHPAYPPSTTFSLLVSLWLPTHHSSPCWSLPLLYSPG